MFLVASNAGAAEDEELETVELDGAAEDEELETAELDGVAQAAKIMPSAANIFPFFNCMFIVYLLMNSYSNNIKGI